MDLIINILIVGFYLILLGFFIHKTTRKHRPAPYLLINLIFGVFGGFFAIFSSSTTFFQSFNYFLLLQLFFYGLQFFFFYLFLEDISEMKPKTSRLMFMYGLLITQIIALLFIVLSSSISEEILIISWILEGVGFNISALYVFLFFGIATYYKIYKYTKEKQVFGFISGLFIGSLGFILNSVYDTITLLYYIRIWPDSVRAFINFFPMIGLLLFMITYLRDIDYIYRLPHDHFLLMITHKNGIALYTAEFESKKDIEINESFFSGFISNVNYVYEDVLKSPSSIENVSGKEASILIRSKKELLFAFVTHHPTAMLTRALERFVIRFEEKFKSELESKTKHLGRFQESNKLIKEHFPFLKIKKNHLVVLDK
ncbi:MAG: hypothetical protein GF311_13515 [Candidatus Lokiarchaeota archaeon]|nr:hypothetical protein [Candidatus Lokiarchaeota archaeon]